MHTNKITTDNLEKIRKKVAASATKNINEWNEQARIINKRNAYKADEFKTDLHHEDSNLKSDTYNFVNKKIVDAEDSCRRIQRKTQKQRKSLRL